MGNKFNKKNIYYHHEVIYFCSFIVVLTIVTDINSDIAYRTLYLV